MNNNIFSNIRKVTPYTPGDQPDFKDMIKLNTNENPYPPSPKVLEVLKTYDSKDLRLYPSPDSARLTEKISEYHGVNAKNVFVGVGSDDVLSIAFMTFFNSQKPILYPRITYSFYDVWAELYKIPVASFELNEDFSVNPDDFFKDNGGIVIANPNAPTGVALDKSNIKEIIERNQDSVVIIDEAYADFNIETMMEFATQYSNVIVVRTYSKSRSMAGMRIGYAVADEELIHAMNDIRYSINSYPMTRVSIEAGVASLEDEEYFRTTVEKIIKTREWTKGELERLGFSFPDSKTNFIFASHKSVPAILLFEKLKEKHIFVRYFKTKGIDNNLRITVGTDSEMKTLIEELEAIISEYNA
jgi:histidinol-phosphate aminotransferase